MANSGNIIGAIDSPNQFVESKGRSLAYRSIGTGKPIPPASGRGGATHRDLRTRRSLSGR